MPDNYFRDKGLAYTRYFETLCTQAMKTVLLIGYWKSSMELLFLLNLGFSRNTWSLEM